MSFRRCLEEGKKAEDRFADLLGQADIVRLPMTTRDWDISFYLPSRGVILAEVKYDKMQAKTGNIALEYYNPRSKLDTGITSSRADVWIYIIDKPASVWATSTRALREFFMDEPFVRDIEYGGDGNSSFRLYRTSHILTIFKRIDEISPEELPGLIEELLE